MLNCNLFNVLMFRPCGQRNLSVGLLAREQIHTCTSWLTRWAGDHSRWATEPNGPDFVRHSSEWWRHWPGQVTDRSWSKTTKEAILWNSPVNGCQGRPRCIPPVSGCTFCDVHWAPTTPRPGSTWIRGETQPASFSNDTRKDLESQLFKRSNEVVYSKLELSRSSFNLCKLKRARKWCPQRDSVKQTSGRAFVVV